jgi:hypothetical protein
MEFAVIFLSIQILVEVVVRRAPHGGNIYINLNVVHRRVTIAVEQTNLQVLT